ncbi:MAG TPA: hypothetical protein VEL28_17235 [Candidatus Binatia bacterium]|nr:hypothetical protein [Candidatus Binatia bacterium]
MKWLLALALLSVPALAQAPSASFCYDLASTATLVLDNIPTCDGTITVFMEFNGSSHDITSGMTDLTPPHMEGRFSFPAGPGVCGNNVTIRVKCNNVTIATINTTINCNC